MSLVITVSLPPGGSARRKEADYPAQLARLVATILLEQRVRIVKDVHGVLEGDAVLPLVGPRFRRVPLEPNHPELSVTLNL